MKIEKEE